MLQRTPRKRSVVIVQKWVKFSVAAVVVCAYWSAGSSAAPAEQATFEKQFAGEVQPVLSQYCYQCHGNGKHKGDLTLDQYKSAAAVQGDGKTWLKVVEMVRNGEMPPAGKPRPPQPKLEALAAWLDAAVEAHDCAGPRDPGHVTIRRLNRNEYNNTIRDLVGVDFKPAADFPLDDTGYGFDNIGDVLSMSPYLAEKYLAAAEQVVGKIESTNKAVVDTKHARWDGIDMTAEVGSEVDGTKHWNLGTEGEIYKERRLDGGRYELRIAAEQDAAGKEPAKMAVRVDGKDLQTFEVKNLRGTPKVYEVQVDVTPGIHKFAAAYLNNFRDPENPDPSLRDRNLIVDWVEVEQIAGSDVAGPAKPQAEDMRARGVFFVRPGKGLGDEAAARQVIERFTTRAYRRPVESGEVDALMKLYRMARGEGDGWEAAVRYALTGVLVSPQFLFRIEKDPATPTGAQPVVHPINDYELATRLSYFLWASMPDPELFSLAGQGKLKQPGVLEGQVKRMLGDPKAEALVKNFLGQWLELRLMDGIVRDRQRYPLFDSRLRDAMQKEVETFFVNLIKEDRPVTEMLDADYTFVNDRLARFYEIDGVKGSDFRKVSLSGTKRGGVLTMAAVLTVTAMPTRTSPVLRGKYVLEEILGTPPPPPPPNVPSLITSNRQRQDAATLRQRLEIHRADPTCASCHMRMDGIGFTLENFDAIGRWRDMDAGEKIDSTGVLPGGTKLDGPESLKKVLVSRKDDFVRCFVEKLLTYAVGRGMETYDRCTIKDICVEAKKDDLRFSAVVNALVRSDAFLKRRAKRPEEMRQPGQAPSMSPANVTSGANVIGVPGAGGSGNANSDRK